MSKATVVWRWVLALLAAAGVLVGVVAVAGVVAVIAHLMSFEVLIWIAAIGSMAAIVTGSSIVPAQHKTRARIVFAVMLIVLALADALRDKLGGTYNNSDIAEVTGTIAGWFSAIAYFRRVDGKKIDGKKESTTS